MYDQDFINGGFADGKRIREAIICPKCGNRATRILTIPASKRKCKKCGTEMRHV